MDNIQIRDYLWGELMNAGIDIHFNHDGLKMVKGDVTYEYKSGYMDFFDCREEIKEMEFASFIIGGLINLGSRGAFSLDK